MEQSQEYLKREFFHYISDTLALLGANPELVEQLHSFEEIPLSKELVRLIQNYNVDLLDNVKTRLVLCQSTGFHVKE